MGAVTEQTVTITVRVPGSMRDQLDELARATARSRQFLALDALQQYIETEGWHIGLIAQRVRQADAGEIAYASPERVAAVFDKYHTAECAG